MSQHDARNHGKSVRNACDACHTRKVRCIIPQGGGPCINCQNRGLSCYFLPKYKSGRPRVNHSCRQPPPRTLSIDTFSSPLGESDKDLWMQTSEPPNQHEVGWQDFCDVDSHIWDVEAHCSIANDHLMATPTPSDDSPQNQGTRQSQPRVISNIPSISSHCLDTMVSPSPGICPEQRPTSETEKRNDTHCHKFTDLLQSGLELEHLIEALTRVKSCSRANILSSPGQTTTTSINRAQDPPIQLTDTVEAVDSCCHLLLSRCGRFGAASKASQDTLDLATRSLVIAMAHKVLQACSLVVEQYSDILSSAHGGLMQKRLDLNTMQIRFVAAWMGQNESHDCPSVGALLHGSDRLSKELMTSPEVLRE